MIKNQWYAVLSSHKLKPGKLLAARRFGEDLIFFRTASGEAACVTHLCPHRGASLSKGCIKDNHLQCPFHGIEFDHTGKCVLVPSEGRAATANFDRFHLKTYPLHETGGIIFAWYGEAAPVAQSRGEIAEKASGDGNTVPEIHHTVPDIFDVITDPSYSYDHTEDHWRVHYSRVIENQLDVSHLAFVHRTTIGRGNKTLANGPKVVWLDENTMQTSANNAVDTGQTPLRDKDCEIKQTNLNFKFPNLWLNHVSDKILILAFFIPVDDENAIIALRFYNRITGFRPVDKFIAMLGSIANKIVERQDKRIVETQIPKKSTLKMGEKLVMADKPIIEYRRKREELQNRGQ